MILLGWLSRLTILQQAVEIPDTDSQSLANLRGKNMQTLLGCDGGGPNTLVAAFKTKGNPALGPDKIQGSIKPGQMKNVESKVVAPRFSFGYTKWLAIYKNY